MEQKITFGKTHLTPTLVQALLWNFFIYFFILPLSSTKAGRFEKLLGFARSHSIVTRGSVSLLCTTSPHPSCFSKSKRYKQSSKDQRLGPKYPEKVFDIRGNQRLFFLDVQAFNVLRSFDDFTIIQLQFVMHAFYSYDTCNKYKLYNFFWWKFNYRKN